MSDDDFFGTFPKPPRLPQGDEVTQSLQKIAEERQRECDHGLVFDEEEAKKMSVEEIRKKFPRLFGSCPKGCGYSGIAYVSWAHYVYGDW